MGLCGETRRGAGGGGAEMAEDAPEGGGELVHHESFLDLLMRQQTRGEQGVR